MPRKSPSRRIPGLDREAVPVAPHCDCDGLCFDISCPHYWDWFPADLWFLPGGPAAKATRVPVDLDDETYAAVQADAVRRGVTVADVVRGVLRQWADKRR
jgi:hypothetical protein